MKSAVIALGALVASASAAFNISMPDNSSVWHTGSTGNILWNTSATEFGLLCSIQLISVNTELIAWNITNSSVPCSINNYTTGAIPEFDEKKFLIRIGSDNNNQSWVYTQNFKIKSNQTDISSPKKNKNKDNEDENEEDEE
jgi:hypothetical protein